MIDLTRSVRVVYSKEFVDHKFTHPEKVLLVAACLARGIVGQSIATKLLRKAWPKSLFSVVYHPDYLVDCESKGWIDRSHGTMKLTDEGLDYLNSLTVNHAADPMADLTELMVFSPKKAHDFDSLLRKVFSSATTHVKIADSYVDETIFDTLLNVIPTGVKIDLMINHGDTAVFQQRARRFQVQYPDFHYAHYPKLHDRYLIADNISFVIGPSLKDATVNAPAIIVRMDSLQSKKLITLFDNIYSKVTKVI